jgi:Holliday junction resolvase
MTHPNKVKGNKFERDCVKAAEKKDLVAKRAWASDGRSLGETSETDIIIKSKYSPTPWRMQCKIRKNLPKWLQVDWNEVDGFIIRQDRDRPLVLIDYDDFLDLIKEDK